MSCSSKGRSYRKLYDTIPIPPATLGSVVNESNTATIGAKFGGDLEATGFVKGDGSLLTNLPSAPTVTLTSVCNNDNVATIGAVFQGDLEATGFVKGNGSQLTNLPVPNLQAVTSVNSSTPDKVSFQNLVTSLETSGNVLVTGNVTASKFYGSGSELTSIASQTDLNDNSSRISTLEGKTIITNTSGITTNFTKGDILYASGNGTLSKRGISSTAGQVLTVSSGVPIWSTAPGVSSLDTRITNLESEFIITSTSGITGFTQGDILYATGNSTLARLQKGNAGQFLSINSSGLPAWTNGPSASTSFITEAYTGPRNARLGFHNTAPQHTISFGTSYYDESGTTGSFHISGNVFAEFYYGDGSGLTNLPSSASSDARLKSNVVTISNSLDVLSKLKPYMYEKDGREESGFMAQDIWYDAPELKHAVIPGDDATPNETKNEPSYDDWGKEHAKLDYHCIISYAVGAINELREMVEQLEK